MTYIIYDHRHSLSRRRGKIKGRRRRIELWVLFCGREQKSWAELMEEFPGALGTSASLALRLGQTIFSVGSLLFMCLRIEFYSYTAFCFLVTIKGLVIPWSLTLALVDAFCVFVKSPTRQVGVIVIVVVGDWVLSFLSLAAASSTASVADFLLSEGGPSICGGRLCSRYQLSAAMAFLSWCLSIASSLFNLWLLPSLL